MKQQVFNPYLPSWEYIPDGEPHVFGDRVYVYGSHDKFNGRTFCINDYVTWSAPIDDLSDWRYEGVIWKKSDDPHYKGKGSMYAPDVCQAPDGKYYLYYAFAPSITRKSWAIRCAVSNKPTGPFTYHGEVDLFPYSKEYLPFDPAVYVENGRVWLYYGSAMFFPVLGVSKKKLKGGAVVELDPKDMLTVIGAPKQTLPIRGKDLGEHGFFEASSMRKIKDKYYFIYSSTIGHELCYAIGDKPDGPFTFGGTIVSIGDIGLKHHKDVKNASNHTGNTHGSILQVGDKFYIFYHRHTNRHCFSRQDCAEEIKIEQDGSIKQVEVTSCGLNGKPLIGTGEYEARIACNLISPQGNEFHGSLFKHRKGSRPYFTQSGKDREDSPDQHIANFRDGATAGFKYFDIKDLKKIGVKVKGNAKGSMFVRTELDGKPVAEIPVIAENDVKTFYGEWKGDNGVKALYFTFEGKGKCDFISIILE